MLRTLLFGAALVLLPALAWAASPEYHVAQVESAAPTDDLPQEIAALLQPTGFKLVKGESRTVCEIWLCKQWPVAADAKTGDTILYPLTAGQLVGVVRYPRKATDFRDQEIPAGVYTLRYGQQPVDGAHVGTSPTRDFLVVSPAAKDKSPLALDYKTLIGLGKETSGASHPAILSLHRPGETTDALLVREDSDKEWIIVRFTGQTKAGDVVQELAVEAVLVGVAAE